MKSLRLAFSSLVAAVLLSAAAFAADPTGTWKWSTQGPNGSTMEPTLKLALKGQELTGSLSGFRGGDAPISDGTYKDGTVAFTVVREMRNGNKVTMKYEGKVEGDAIKGTVQTSGRAEPTTRDWNAARVKEEPEKTKS